MRVSEQSERPLTTDYTGGRAESDTEMRMKILQSTMWNEGENVKNGNVRNHSDIIKASKLPDSIVNEMSVHVNIKSVWYIKDHSIHNTSLMNVISTYLS